MAYHEGAVQCAVEVLAGQGEHYTVRFDFAIGEEESGVAIVARLTVESVLQRVVPLAMCCVRVRKTCLLTGESCLEDDQEKTMGSSACC